jgi:hypothetical protein
MTANSEADRGSSTVLAITCCAVFLMGALVWVSGTVDRSVNDRADAAEVAFQAARAGAQSIDRVAARRGELVLDAALARGAALRTARQLLAANGDTGAVTALAVDRRRVTVPVTITTTGRPATSTASASARLGVDRPDR